MDDFRGTHRLYDDLASWFHLLTPPSEYEEEAAVYTDVLLTAGPRPPQTVLELGSGGGNNASHMSKTFELTLVDRSASMLAISRALNPGCEHIESDMRTLRLGRTFDAVFVHDAISYITTRDDLRSTIETAFVHCRPGGVALFVPDETKESLTEGCETGGNDAADRGLRYLQWTWDPDASDDWYVADFAYLLKEGGRVRVEHDRHICGAFPRALWVGLLSEMGFVAEARPAPYDGTTGIELFVAVRPEGRGSP